MANLLVEGGRLVLVDMDMRDTFTMPPSPFYESILAEVVFPYGAHIGVDYAVGVRLPELMSGAGLAIESVVVPRSSATAPRSICGSGRGRWRFSASSRAAGWPPTAAMS